jgi:hypothetical protein
MVADTNISCIAKNNLDILQKYSNYFEYKIIENSLIYSLVEFSNIQEIPIAYHDISSINLYSDNMIIDKLMISDIELGDYDIIQINDFILCGGIVIPDYLKNCYIITYKIIIKI